MRRNYLLLIIPIFIFYSCASYHQLMVGPDGSITDCHASGTGLVGIAAASGSVASCKEALQKAGYINIEDAGVVGIVFRSDSSLTVLKVMPNSPAELAGIKPNDKIIKVNGQRVTNIKDAQLLLFGYVNELRDLTVAREGEIIEFKRLELAPYTLIYGK